MSKKSHRVKKSRIDDIFNIPKPENIENFGEYKEEYLKMKINYNDMYLKNMLFFSILIGAGLTLIILFFMVMLIFNDGFIYDFDFILLGIYTVFVIITLTYSFVRLQYRKMIHYNSKILKILNDIKKNK